MKLEAVRSWRRRAGREAASTTTGRVGTARRPGPGKQDGEVYDTETSYGTPSSKEPARNLADQGRTAVHAPLTGGDSQGRILVAGPEATVKVCGVAVARPQGNSWAPIPSNG